MNKLDKKFHGHIVKVKDNSIVPEDQYVVFLAKDNAFFATLPKYLENCINLGADKRQIELVNQMINNISIWREENKEKCKVPDAEGEITYK